jgi:hypothetical protein
VAILAFFLFGGLLPSFLDLNGDGKIRTMREEISNQSNRRGGAWRKS